MSATPDGEGAEDEAQPIKGVSLPTIPLDEEEQEREVPSEELEGSPSEDWLEELRESTDEVDQDAEDLESPERVEKREEDIGPVDIPDWLAEIGSVSEGTQGSRSPEELPSDEASDKATKSADISEQRQDLPPPQGMAPEDKTSPAEDEDPLEPAEIPEWLIELRSEQSEALTQANEEPSAVEGQAEEKQRAEQPQDEALFAEKPKLEELPEWLQETIGTAAEAEQPLQPDETESSIDEPLDQLEEAPAAGGGLPSRESPSGETEGLPSAESVETPEWLQDIGGGQEKTPPEEPTIAFTETPPETFEPPEWLRDLMDEEPLAEEEPSPLSSGAVFADEGSSGMPEPAEIPQWLRDLRPSKAEHEETPEAPPETEGLLKGLRGLIPASSGIEAPASYKIQSTAGTAEASRARAQLLQSLLGQPHARPRPELEEKGSETRRRLEQWIVAVVLLVSVLGMLLAPLLIGETPRLTEPVAASGAARLFEIVNGLEATDTVLVAFDYGPAEADELNSVTEPVLEHLIDSDGRLSIVSTRPDASPVAAALMSKVTNSSDQYTLLGYRPGADTAASHLLAAVDEPPALLLILTSRPGPLLRWVEQVQARYEGQIQVATASSALLEPVTTPYLDVNAGQLGAAIHGLRGAAAYETLRGKQGAATQQLNTLAAGHVAIVALMIVGAVIYGIGGAEREET